MVIKFLVASAVYGLCIVASANNCPDIKGQFEGEFDTQKITMLVENRVEGEVRAYSADGGGHWVIADGVKRKAEGTDEPFYIVGICKEGNVFEVTFSEGQEEETTRFTLINADELVEEAVDPSGDNEKINWKRVKP